MTENDSVRRSPASPVYRYFHPRRFSIPPVIIRHEICTTPHFSTCNTEMHIRDMDYALTLIKHCKIVNINRVFHKGLEMMEIEEWKYRITPI